MQHSERARVHSLAHERSLDEQGRADAGDRSLMPGLLLQLAKRGGGDGLRAINEPCAQGGRGRAGGAGGTPWPCGADLRETPGRTDRPARGSSG